MNAIDLGKKIQDLRRLKGFTQEELADKTGLSSRTIQRIENGEVDARSYTLNRMAEALEVELEILLTEENNSNLLSGFSKLGKNQVLALFHLSGIFICIIPPVLFWIIKKNDFEEINDHAVDILNFQISMLIYLIGSSFLLIILIGLPLLIFLGVFSTVIIILNSIRVLMDKDYRYPLNMNIIKDL